MRLHTEQFFIDYEFLVTLFCSNTWRFSYQRTIMLRTFMAFYRIEYHHHKNNNDSPYFFFSLYSETALVKFQTIIIECNLFHFCFKFLIFLHQNIKQMWNSTHVNENGVRENAQLKYSTCLMTFFYLLFASFFRTLCHKNLGVIDHIEEFKEWWYEFLVDLKGYIVYS